MTVLSTTRIKMQDGTQLATDIHLPKGDGPWPLLIARTPYGRQAFTSARKFVEYGYAVLLQDVRGRGDSDGQFMLLAQEPPDAVETARWALSQPWCDGRLGILGVSYLSAASIAIAAEFPDEVKACIWATVPVEPALLTSRGGVRNLHHLLPWVMLSEGRDLGKTDWSTAFDGPNLAALLPDSMSWQMITLPLTHPFWQAQDLSAYLRRVKAPGIHLGGWYDFMVDATLKPYQILLEHSGSAQRLVIGPWSHNEIYQNPVFWAETVQWLDMCFSDDLPSTGGVQLYPSGAESSVSVPIWLEPARALYLSSNGSLTDVQPPQSTATYTYNPAEPCPTQGGAVWEFSPAGLDPGPTVQSTAGRPDVLRFETPPLSNDLTVAGAVLLELLVHSTAPSMDFTGKLCDVAPDGTARYVTDGIRRVEACPPEDSVRVTVEMACGHLFKAGHQLRLEVSSSNFPKYERSPWAGANTLTLGESRLLIP